MSEEENQEQREANRTKKDPDNEEGRDATDAQVEREEETGGALPQNRTDES